MKLVGAALLLVWAGGCDARKTPAPPSVKPPEASTATASAEPTSSMTSPSPSAWSPSSWARDQPRLGHFVVHRGQLVIRAGLDHHLVVDGSAKELKPFVAPCSKLEQVLETALVCVADGKRRLMLDVSGTYRERALPEAAADPKTPWVAGARAGKVVVLEGTRMHVLDGLEDDWTSHELGPAPTSPSTRGLPSLVHVAGDVAYAGYDRGEWGGALFALALDHPRWKPLHQVAERSLGIPVHTITAGPKGATWVVFGLAHLSLREGAVARFHGTEGKLVVDNQRAPFPFDDAEFASMAFDERGALYVLSGAHGILRQTNGAWDHLTPSWTTFTYVQDLAVRGNTAVVALYDAGMVFIDLQSQEVVRRRLPVPTP